MSACSFSPEFVIETMTLDQPSWDSLSVGAAYRYQPLLGPNEEVQPDIAVFTVFSATYDTLYSGSAGTIGIPDLALNDRERILVEVCGYYLEHISCEQKSVFASPKRVSAEYDVAFPADTLSTPSNFVNGDIYVATRLERQKMDSEIWEVIRRPSKKDLHVHVYMEGISGASVRIPISRSETSFNLSRFAGFRDLRYGIQSSLMDSDSAVVHFDLHARTTDPPALVESRRVVLRSKSEEERMLEVRELVERTGTQILEHLSSLFGSRRAYVFINEWTFEPLNKAYNATFELHWQETFRGEWADLSGQLLVRSNGTLGTFTFERGSEHAEEKWNDRIVGDTLELKPLFPNLMPETDPTRGDEEPSRQ